VIDREQLLSRAKHQERGLRPKRPGTPSSLRSLRSPDPVWSLCPPLPSYPRRDHLLRSAPKQTALGKPLLLLWWRIPGSYRCFVPLPNQSVPFPDGRRTRLHDLPFQAGRSLLIIDSSSSCPPVDLFSPVAAVRSSFILLSSYTIPRNPSTHGTGGSGRRPPPPCDDCLN